METNLILHSPVLFRSETEAVSGPVLILNAVFGHL